MNSDLIELLRLLNVHRVRYLLIGGQAVIAHSEPRYTKDVDIWLDPSAANARRAYNALKEFGAPTDSITIEDLATPGTVFIFGVEPNRVDLLNRVKGASFKASYKNRLMIPVSGINIALISLNDLIKIKRATGRPQDLLDLEKLERSRRLLSKTKKGARLKKKS